ncbi:MAG: hypothetical protein VXA48_17935 [Deltaproteobacteria bacterium]
MPTAAPDGQQGQSSGRTFTGYEGKSVRKIGEAESTDNFVMMFPEQLRF